MTALENLKQFRSFPSTIIVNGLSGLGFQVAQTLLEQRGVVIIIDKLLTKDDSKRVEQLKKFESFAFINSAEEELHLAEIKKLDYLLILDHDQLDFGDRLTPNDFLQKINRLNKYLRFAVDKKVKVLLTTSLKTHQFSISDTSLEDYSPRESAHSEVEQQRYEEKTTFYFQKKSGLDARVLRLGEIYGPYCDLDKDTVVNDLIKQSQKSRLLKIKGDGLEENFIIHINDATYGIIKALFSPETNGEIFNLANFEDNSTLSIAYALIEADTKAKEVRFLNESYKPITTKFDPTPNLSKIGWKPRVPIEKGLRETIQWINRDKTEVSKKKKCFSTKEVKRPSFGNNLLNNIKNLFKKTYGFFFISEEQFLLQKRSGKKGILTNLSIKTRKKKRVYTEKILKKKLVKKKNFSKLKKEIARNIRCFKANKLKYAPYIAAILLYIFVLEPFLGFWGNLTLSGLNGYKAVNNLRDGNYPALQKNLSSLETSMSRSQNFLERTEPFFKISGRYEQYTNIVKFISAARHLARGGAFSVDLLEPMISYGKSFSLNPEQDADFEKYMKDMTANSNKFDLAYIELIQADKLFGQVDFADIPVLSNHKDSIPRLQNDFSERINKYKDVIYFLPNALGYPEEKTYLLIFQNDTELRSTGGFIGSYGLVNFEKGRLRELFIDDVYNPDGQLTEYIEPPPVLKEFLGEHGWAFRDANWEADFPTSARQLEWFFELETQKKVDGVIAINTSIIEKILEQLGTVYVEEEDAVISANNFLDEAEKHHLTFVPGSMDKRDFLGALAAAVLQEVENKDASFLMNIATVIEELLNSRELFIYLNDARAQKFFSRNEWDGSVSQFNGEFLFPVENNLGGNKVNRYVERTIDHEIAITETNVLNKLKIKYENKSKTNSWPGGIYNNFITIFIPKDSVDIRADGLLDYKVEDKYGYKAISGVSLTDSQSSSEIIIQYSSNSLKTIPVGKKQFDYLLQKQSGAEETYVNLTVIYPQNWSLIERDSDLTERINDNQIRYFGIQEADIEIGLKFSTEIK